MIPKAKRPRDTNQLSKHVVDLAVGEITQDIPSITTPPKNPAAVELGRLGGLKGGKARAKALSAEQRREIGLKGAKARWGK